ncbi:MAG: hypothetical protein HY749_25165 [Gammaproteobacteria bacterium]|nr:hypothetical protein [Gammaproteobacteria bacterium]MBI5618618.1 hypothetical protein [Gammaproteobacteria bacterium]
MNVLVLRVRSRFALMIFTVFVITQLIGLAPGIEYLAGAFPTHFHRGESVAVFVSLFSSLVLASFGPEPVAKIAHTILGGLAFYSALQLLSTFGNDAPAQVKMIWGSVRLFVTAVLGWLLLTAFRSGKLGWREAFYSLGLANLGFVYLKLVAVFSS